MTDHPHDPARSDDSVEQILADWGLAGGDAGSPQSLGPEAGFSWTKLVDRGNQGPPELLARRSTADSQAIVADFGLLPGGADEIGNGPDGNVIENVPAHQWATTTHKHLAHGGPVDSARENSWPGPNDSVGGFHIILELGRGAFARVFLAAELNLGHRLVAIKVSQPEGDEPQILAQRQHTHIVAVH